MSSSTQPGVEERPADIAAKHIRRRILAGLAVLALVILLLVWGFSAMQWTILTTNNNLRDALVTSKFQIETATYSIPQDMRSDYPVSISFKSPSTGCAGSSGTLSIPTRCLPMPVSNSSTTLDDYVIYSMTNPNGSALAVWYSDPQGNLTQDCSGSSQFVVICNYEPNPPGVTTGPYLTFFKAATPGNYTVHLLSEHCTITPNCSTTTATGTLALAISTITYDRPYWASGLATVIVAAASIVTTITFIAITVYQIRKVKPRPTRPTRGHPPSQTD